MSDTGLASVLAGARFIPVLTVPDATMACPLAEALSLGGARCGEITFRTPDAEQALKAMAAHGELVVGAGTVLTAEQAERAVAAGARFVVTPSFDEEVVAKCRELGVPAVPGIATATELACALRAGADTVTLFPAEPLGGIRMLRALAAPSRRRDSCRPAASAPPSSPATSTSLRYSPWEATGRRPPSTWSGATTKRSAD